MRFTEGARQPPGALLPRLIKIPADPKPLRSTHRNHEIIPIEIDNLYISTGR
jgi:hypothetical protein